jgi:hypothetical protein
MVCNAKDSGLQALRPKNDVTNNAIQMNENMAISLRIKTRIKIPEGSASGE